MLDYGMLLVTCLLALGTFLTAVAALRTAGVAKQEFAAARLPQLWIEWERYSICEGPRVLFRAKVYSSAPAMFQSVTRRIQEDYCVGTEYFLDHCGFSRYEDVRELVRPEEAYELTVGLLRIRERPMVDTRVTVGLGFRVSPVGLPELAREWKGALVAVASGKGSEPVFDTNPSYRFFELEKEPGYRERIREMLQRWDDTLERWKREV